jgi:hypothetical protein
MTTHTNAAAIDIINELYVGAWDELMNAYGLTARAWGGGDPGHRGPGILSFLGATGTGVNLLSILNPEAKLLASLYPSPGGEIVPSQLEDWCGELNNQLVGRLKNKLLGYGLKVLVGIPSLVTGQDISALTPPESETRTYRFTAPDGAMALTLAVIVAPGLEPLALGAGEAEQAMKEGEMFFF